MPGIVDFPTVVEDAVAEFGGLFANAPERRHFAEYLTGLMVAERKNVSAINAEFVETTDQSCLNRWITQVRWDGKWLNEHRLEWLQERPSTRYSGRGVIAIDNTLVGHSGDKIEQEGETDTSFKSHTELFKELVDGVVFRQIPGDFAFDCYFSSVECLDHIHSHERGYVGALKSNRKVEFKGGLMKATEVAANIPPEDRKQVSIGKRKQWYFTKTLSLPKLKHRVRLVILWDRKNGREAVKFLLTHRVHWEISRILNVYRKRWTGTETFHRDGKHHLGMGDGQLRSGEGQTRHRYLVMLTHSLLMARRRQGRARDWAHSVLTTIGEACRAVSRETLSKTISWVVDQATIGWTQERIVAHLKLV